MAKAFALVRSTFHVDPETLSDERFATLLSEALWLKQFEQDMMEAAVVKAIGKIFSKQ